MFLVPKNTQMFVEPKKTTPFFYCGGLIPYTTKEDKLYDKHEVWDLVRVLNTQDMNPSVTFQWIKHYVMKGNVVLQRKGRYGIVNAAAVQYLD